MRYSFFKPLVLALFAVPVVASAADYVAADSNGDGVLSLDEVQAILPEVTSDIFITIDADGDGLLNADEIAVAQTDGLLPASDG